MIGETVTTNNTNLTNQRKEERGKRGTMEIFLKDEAYAIIGACFELKATGYRLGLLVNFGAHGKLLYERIVR